MNSEIARFARKSVLQLTPYSSARDEFVGKADVFLDANENSYGSPLDRDYSRYPDPYQIELKSRIAELEDQSLERIFVGNGSDEVIDLLIRIFCEPGTDSIVICPPTYGMYEVSAAINSASLVEVPLNSDFELDTSALASKVTKETKILFVCSPNNPTGNSIPAEQILEVAGYFPGIVVVDEAYANFAPGGGFLKSAVGVRNIVVMRTFSKAWGLAGLRVGLAYADPEVISLLNKIKPPYNVSEIAQQAALDAIRQKETYRQNVESILAERDKLVSSLESLEAVEKVFPSDANFLLVRFTDAAGVYRYLADRGIVVRDRSSLEGCEGCLRITIGTEIQNRRLVESLSSYARGTVA